jgi:hypothetical protein
MKPQHSVSLVVFWGKSNIVNLLILIELTLSWHNFCRTMKFNYRNFGRESVQTHYRQSHFCYTRKDKFPFMTWFRRLRNAMTPSWHKDYDAPRLHIGAYRGYKIFLKSLTNLNSRNIYSQSVQNHLFSASQRLKHKNSNFTFVLYGCENWTLAMREEHRLGCLGTGCWGEYLNLRGRKWWEGAET